METERALYPTADALLAWAALYGPEENRGACGRELALRVLGEADGPLDPLDTVRIDAPRRASLPVLRQAHRTPR